MTTRMRALMVGVGCALWATGMLGCSSAPPPQEPDLVADPPIGRGVDSGGANADLDRGVAYIKHEKFEEAIPLLEKALETEPDSAMATFYLAIAHDMTGKKKEAEDGYRRALSLDEKLVEAAQNLAAILLDEPPRAKEAVGVLTRAIKVAPDDLAVRRNLAYAYALLGDTAAASEHYEAILAKKDDPEVHFAYGTLLFEAKKIDEAVPHLDKAAAGAEDPALLATIGRMMGYAKRFDACVALFDRALAKKSDDPEWFVRRGTCKHELGDEKAASADFEKALGVDEGFAAAHYYLGLSLLAQHKPQSAKKSLEKAAALGKDSPIGKLAKDKLKSL